jgi:hypothetical protein
MHCNAAEVEAWSVHLAAELLGGQADDKQL